MRHTAGQSSHRFHLLRLSQLRLCFPQYPFRSSSLAELTDLETDVFHHLQPLVIGLPHLAAEEFDDTLDLTPYENRKSKRPVEPDLPSRRATKKIGIRRHIRHPCRLSARPNPSGQTLPAYKRSLPGVQSKRIGLHGRRLPLIETTQRSGRLIHPPKHTQIPFQALADCLDDFWNSLFQGRRFGEHSGHRILRGETPFCLAAVCDVPDKCTEDVRIADLCRRNRKFNGKFTPVLVLSDNFNATVQDCSGPCSEKFSETVFVRLTIPLRDDGLGKGAAQCFLARPSEDRRGLRIPIGHNPARIDGDDPVERGVDNRSISLLTLKQRGFSGFCPRTFLSCLPMFHTQAPRRPEQQPQHGNPDHPTYDPNF